jgi:hypothetical protein
MKLKSSSSVKSWSWSSRLIIVNLFNNAGDIESKYSSELVAIIQKSSWILIISFFEFFGILNKKSSDDSFGSNIEFNLAETFAGANWILSKPP